MTVYNHARVMYVLYVVYESMYTTENPSQLPITPMAEYELVNINGRNSYLSPNTIPCTSEQYAINGIDTAIYKRENRSSRKTRV
jgi:hypothetical protein